MRRMILLILFGLLLATHSDAEPVRVATWSLHGLVNDKNDSQVLGGEEERLRELATVLTKADLDIIILQQVPNKIACQKLADHLKPGQYQVAVCSEFPDGTGRDNRHHQVAILSRQPALAVWSDKWKSVNSVDASRGYVFAAVQHGNKVVGVYSLELKDNAVNGHVDLGTQLNILQRERAAEQLVRDIGSISQRFKSTIDAFIVAGNFNTDPEDGLFVSENTLHLFEEAGFSNAFQRLPSEHRVTALGEGGAFAATLVYVLGKNVAFASNPKVLSTQMAGSAPMVVDLDVQTTPIAVGTVPSASPFPGQRNTWLMAGLVALLSVFCFLLWRLTRGGAETALVPAKLPNPDSVASIITCPSCEEPIAVAPDASGALQPKLLADVTGESSQQEGLKELKPGEKATASLREKLIPHLARLMMNKLVRALIFQRRDLLETQRKAATQMNQLEERLNKLPPRMKGRLRAYERRIAELEKDLADKGEENRELIRAQIVLMKKELAEEKSRNRLTWN
jgi:endonuclease/exonuclease/phosphatase family metal-dependent hydrolase